ncbi:SUMF1/EgtB/PvdO family nonheme iron enzyme [Aerosakkonemataceae cyanobacterium BLCC-F50]|uniref:SUMF1/EgtB/PvdO family nonheme iron enzyme n=1 Tax=Floridaenema flaviceps BLCC-F50 TaxID=3153642 RepID=A0ABV4XM30_9CYAN
MQICQNPNCPNPFNPDGNRFCSYCGANNLGTLFRNRFRVIGLIGEGGFGRTYQAEDVDKLDDPCVIKQFVPQVQGTAALNKAAELFKQEAKRLFELGDRHSQIPRLIAYFEQGTRLYLVQEFIKGQTLLEEVRQGAFNEEQILQILHDLLPVLKFIHESNVIHRDIKPDNIIRRQKDGKLVLIDFGGAKQVTQTSLAKAATGIYTPGYAPTEQMAGRPCHGSDLYSLGATCVRLLTGCLPVPDISGEFDDPLYDAHEGHWLWREYLQKKGLKFSSELGKLLDKLLAHFPKDRFQSSEEVLQILNSPKPNHKSTTSTAPKSNPPKTASTTTIPEANNAQTNVKRSSNLQLFEFDVVTVDSTGKKIKTERSQAEFFVEDLGNGVTLEMVSIPGGKFIMGSPKGEGKDNERPQHRVNVASFFMGKSPVTQAQWKAVAALPKIKTQLDPDPSHFKGANRPVEKVSWGDAVEFCARLSKKTGRIYRLPSEAEWEYACRAGTTTPFHFGETINSDLARYDGRYTYASEPKGIYWQKTTIVESVAVANAFGLYDMHGNIWEWCADPWHKNYLGAPSNAAVWEMQGNYNYRVLRGGSWYVGPASCTSAFRSFASPSYRHNDSGFRLVYTVRTP